jgi:fibronectin type 3 domain-containing protein
VQTVFSNEKEFKIFKEWTYGLLRDNNVKHLCVTFTKKDGTERDMQCTLVSTKIPADKQPTTTIGLEEETNRQIDGSAVRVFDIEKQEWRSFRWDSVKKVSFDL